AAGRAEAHGGPAAAPGAAADAAAAQGADADGAPRRAAAGTQASGPAAAAQRAAAGRATARHASRDRIPEDDLSRGIGRVDRIVPDIEVAGHVHARDVHVAPLVEQRRILHAAA